MNKFQHKIYALLALCMFFPMTSFAQWETDSISDARDFIYEAAPIALVVIFLAGVIFNIGKVWGSEPDWKSFFKSLLIFVIAVSFVVGIVGYLATLTFR